MVCVFYVFTALVFTRFYFAFPGRIIPIVVFCFVTIVVFLL